MRLAIIIMKILILKFPYSSRFGGGETHTISLVEELSQRSFKFFLLSSCRVLLKEFEKRGWSAKYFWAGQEPVSKWALVKFTLLAPFIFLGLMVLLFHFKFLKKVKALYMLSLTEKIFLTLPAYILGLKVFWMEHISPERWLTLNPYKIFYILFSRLVTIITPSESLKKEFVKLGVKENRIKVIYHGIKIQPTTNNQQPTQHTTQTLSGGARQATKFTVGTVLRLEKEKGVEFLIEAVSIVKDTAPNVQLIIVGDGSQKKKLEKITQEFKIEKQVRFVGFQKDIKKWVASFDVFVLPSAKRESFGLVLLEAMALKKPIVATRIGGIPEVVEEDSTGILVEPKNSRELAQAILDLYKNTDQRKIMGEKGRQRVKEKFTLEKMIREYEKLFSC